MKGLNRHQPSGVSGNFADELRYYFMRLTGKPKIYASVARSLD